MHWSGNKLDICREGGRDLLSYQIHGWYWEANLAPKSKAASKKLGFYGSTEAKIDTLKKEQPTAFAHRISSAAAVEEYYGNVRDTIQEANTEEEIDAEGEVDGKELGSIFILSLDAQCHELGQAALILPGRGAHPSNGSIA